MMVGCGSDSFSINEVSEGLEKLAINEFLNQSRSEAEYCSDTDPVVKKGFDYFFFCHVF